MRKIAGLHCISILPEAIPRTFKMYGTNWMQKSAPDRIPIATPPCCDKQHLSYDEGDKLFLSHAQGLEQTVVADFS